MEVRPLVPEENYQQLDYMTMLMIVEINGEDVAVAVRLRHVAPEVCTEYGNCISTLILERIDALPGSINAVFSSGRSRLVVDGFVILNESNQGDISGELTTQIQIRSWYFDEGSQYPLNPHFIVGRIETIA
jgi:hypothetical protein